MQRLGALLPAMLGLLGVSCISTTGQTEFMRTRPGFEVRATTAEMRLRTVMYARWGRPDRGADRRDLRQGRLLQLGLAAAGVALPVVWLWRRGQRAV